MASRDTLYTEIPQDVLQVRALGERHCVPQDCVSSVGVTERDAEYVVKIGIKHGTREQLELPSTLTEDDVIIEEVGTFSGYQTIGDTSEKEEFAFTSNEAWRYRRAKYRPVPMGVGAAHEDVSQGVTSFLLEADDGTVYVSSNNHIYGDEDEAVEGDEILQPAPLDGGQKGDDQSAAFVDTVEFSGDNYVDLAWADPVVTHINEPLGLPKPIGAPQVPDMGDDITISGARSGVSTGTVASVDNTIIVSFSSGTDYTFVETILTEEGDMAEPGDSGSPAFGNDNRPTGLLFAGNNNAIAFCRTTRVESESGLTILTEPLPGATDTAVKFPVQFGQNVGEPSKVWFDLASQWNSPQKNRDIQVVGDEIELSTGEEFGFIVPTAQNWEGS